MLGSLPFVAMGQEHHQTGHLTPLVLSCHQEVVNNDLGTVDKVSELGLPHGE